jgi:hypothetical protein
VAGSVSAGLVLEGEIRTMPSSLRILSAAPSASLEQLVPITAAMVGSEASFRAADVPPSGVHSVSSCWNSTSWPAIWPGVASKVPSL